MKQRWNDQTGHWEPMTNYDYVCSLDRASLAKFLSVEFCNGIAEELLIKWLNGEHKEEVEG